MNHTSQRDHTDQADHTGTDRSQYTGVQSVQGKTASAGTFGAAGYESSLGQVVESSTVYGGEAIPREVEGAHHRTSTNQREQRERHNRYDYQHDQQDRHSPGSQPESEHDRLASLVDAIVQRAARGTPVHLGMPSRATEMPVESHDSTSHGVRAHDAALTLDDLQFDEIPRETTYSLPSQEQELTHETKEIQHLVQMIHADSHLPRSKAFVHQARAMEKYEPEGFVPARFHAFYPVYADMNVGQLNAYFTWRTRIRAGRYIHTSVSSAFVYIYELLNGIGADSALEIYRRLTDFQKNYAVTEPAIEFYLPRWIKDYVIAHHLTGEPVSEQFSRQIAADTDLDRLAHPDAYTDTQVTSALLEISGYRPKESQKAERAQEEKGAKTAKKTSGTRKRARGILSGPLAQHDPHIFDRATSQAWQAVQNCSQTSRSFFDVRIAHHSLVPVTLFAHAVYDPEPDPHASQAQRTVTIDPLCSYRFENGHWYWDHVSPLPDRKSEIRGLLHEIDRISRIVWKFGRPLKPRGYFPVYTQEITNALQKVRQQEEKEAWEKDHPPIHIDLSQLSQIRSDAAGTRDSLLTEEEKQAEAQEVRTEQQEQQEQYQQDQKTPEQRGQHTAEVPGANVSRETISQTGVQPSVSGQKQEQAGSPETLDPLDLLEPQDVAEPTEQDDDSVPDLTEPEKYLLTALVTHDSGWKAGLRKRHAMASLLADSINDKLFDQIGDSVIETDDDGNPQLVEDYIPDVKQIVHNFKSTETDTETNENDEGREANND